jgi:hypothetical protein
MHPIADDEIVHEEMGACVVHCLLLLQLSLTAVMAMS